MHGSGQPFGERTRPARRPTRHMAGLIAHAVQVGTDLVPMETLEPLAGHLDGSLGANRFEGAPDINASNDMEAIGRWLASFDDSPQTRRAYAREAERVLLWSVKERGVPMSSLRVDDLQAYFDFLRSPPRRWVESGRAPRTSSAWRPLRGPLTESSLRQARTIVNAMFTWLVQARYLAGNPCALTRSRGRQDLKRPTRYLRMPTWQFLRSWILAMPERTPSERATKARAKHLSALLYLTAARLSDVASGRMGDFDRDDDGAWWWRVVGKGKVEAMLPATSDLMASLREYRVFYGMGPLPSPGERVPLIMRLAGPSAGDKPLSANMVYRSAKQIFEQAAATAEERGLSEISANLRAATTHWMRHTSLTHQLDAGVDLLVVRDNARHASIATTSRYLWKEDRARHAQTNSRHKLDPVE